MSDFSIRPEPAEEGAGSVSAGNVPPEENAFPAPSAEEIDRNLRFARAQKELLQLRSRLALTQRKLAVTQGKLSEAAGMIRRLAALFGADRTDPDWLRACEILDAEASACPASPSEPEAPPAAEDRQEEFVSVILPVYNQVRMLPESIESVLHQTWKNFELIILNDGSSDDILPVMEEYRKRDPRVRLLTQPNQKLPAALSHAFRFARGSFLTWTSADNRMAPDMLRRLIVFLRENPGTDMVFADYRIIDAEGKPCHETWFRPDNRYPADSPDIHLPHDPYLLNRVQDNFVGACFMYRAKVRLALGDYDPALGIEDYDYWMRVNDLFHLSHLDTDEVLYEYRVHDDSLSGHAEDHGIYDKARNLLNLERARTAFYRQPFSCSGSFAPQDFAGCAFSVNGGKDGGKRILLLRAPDLEKRDPEDFSSFPFIAVYFGEADDRALVGKYSWLLRRENVHCAAAPDSAAAEWLRIFTPRLMECGADAFVPFALAVANNFLYRKRTEKKKRDEILPGPAGGSGPENLCLLVRRLGHGGMEQVVYDMARVFRAAGRKAEICVLEPPEVPVPADISVSVCAGREELSACFKRIKPDAVLAHFCPDGAQAAAELGIPYHQIIHNTYVWFSEDDREEYRQADPYTVSYCAVSARAAWYAMEKLSLSASKMVILENGISSRVFRASEKRNEEFRKECGYAEEDFLLLNPATMYGAKGQLVLIRAFALAVRENPSLRLLQAGNALDPVYLESVRAEIRKNGLEDRVRIGKRFADMVPLYQACDGVVFASNWEGCSLAVSEAVRMHRPLLSPRVGDVERQTGGGLNAVLIDFPLRFMTDLDETTFGPLLNDPPEDAVLRLKEGILALAAGRYPKGPWFRDLTMEEAYGRYLRYLDFLAAGYGMEEIRHNLS